MLRRWGMGNIEIVEQIYGAFGRGDVAAILERIDAEVDWEVGMVDGGVPWLRPGKGRAAVGAFFEALGGLEFTKFEVVTVVGAGEYVVGLLNVGFTVRATGKQVSETLESHVWRFEAGRVVAFRHGSDTHQHFLASRA